MTPLDDRIAVVVRTLAADAHPPAHAYDAVLSRAADLKRRRNRFAVGLAASAVAAVVGVSAVVAGGQGSSSAPAPPATHTTSPPSPIDIVADLTGEEVGLALGLEPITESPIIGCNAFAEYENGAGFCLEGLDATAVETWMIAAQITGKTRAEVDQELADLRAAESAPPPPANASARERLEYEADRRVARNFWQMLADEQREIDRRQAD